MMTLEAKYAQDMQTIERMKTFLEENKENLQRVAEILPDVDWQSIYLQSPTIPIKREDLPKLRKAFGKVSVVVKEAKSETELTISVRCKDLPSNWWFQYVVPYKNKEGAKCQIRRVVEEREKWALVCK